MDAMMTVGQIQILKDLKAILPPIGVKIMNKNTTCMMIWLMKTILVKEEIFTYLKVCGLSQMVVHTKNKIYLNFLVQKQVQI